MVFLLLLLPAVTSFTTLIMTRIMEPTAGEAVNAQASIIILAQSSWPNPFGLIIATDEGIGAATCGTGKRGSPLAFPGCLG
ncbi:MAG: hypothetical protein ACXIVE_18695 [Salinarimonas sp.]